MSKIAVLDDRKPQRETILRMLAVNLPNGWECVPSPIFATPEEYPSWLAQNGIHVLLADHVLNEQADEDGSARVDYKAHQVIAAIRKVIPNFPVFLLTAYPNDSELKQHLGDAEAVMNRRTFVEEIGINVVRMTRAANRFAEQHQATLAELSRLSAKIASGKASKEEVERAKSLQALIGLGFDTMAPIARSERLTDIEQRLQKIEELRTKINDFLDSKER